MASLATIGHLPYGALALLPHPEVPVQGALNPHHRHHFLSSLPSFACV